MNFAAARRNMVERQVIARGVTDPQVIAAMLEVPRHLFIEEALRAQAYGDAPLPIGQRQTISQPYMVASMTEALCLRRHDQVLEIGTGSGYQSAILAKIVRRVLTIERIPELARQARRVLDATGCGNVQIRVGDGTLGWPEEAPFDAIIVTAGAPTIPDEYRRQLAIGGRLVIPVGDRSSQMLLRVVRTGEANYREESLLGCRFVPLIGEHGWGNEGNGL
ncbi:MAG: protein-L-isoaspartate O-methyltransferase [Desulfuromonadales bacterium GWD2_61_12]|nr:MAG: protein-L-isoaspartate O-methyltransferase [Desulfuromonadales bacterium GWC2_61_20]OGR33351.1 MAG: protein-L-isoaspartate O-methyltransferase [Desulfuromonadales bacterium GWD2_61_12]HBT82159.1 protein-L-isoaspartate O-methyltransferase [Desulfuromonas sp.]